MVVLSNNEMYSLKMDYDLFENLKKTNPKLKVEVFELTYSTYKRKIMLPIGDCVDWSVARNLQALGVN